jgi:hypothetical protein
VKTVLEAPVLNATPVFGLGSLREPGRLDVATGCARHGYVSPATRVWESPVQPGVKLSTYRITGSSFEHANLNPGAGHGEARQAAKSGDVLDEGRSLRCSLSAGEPRTWR